ncbi:MAG: hypothetical protein KF865_08430 [Bdellovibrionaceae bacterium]|nr:hypothetical protein [Pseudobdellovibrionaceae bacterium]
MKLKAIALATLFASNSFAVVPPDKVPSVMLAQSVPGSSLQAVEDIPDKSRLGLFYNDLLLESRVNLPGWNAQTGFRPNAAGIFEAFGVRTTADPTKVQAGQSLFYAGAGVGRSGVWELAQSGQAFALVNGRPLKGLTIKGYGGNAGKGQQPEGSLDAPEAYRDTLLSKILMEKNVDTYIGALAVVRPTSSGGLNANFIRLSRSSLRMNDLMDRQGADLRATVEHLSHVVADEIGRKPNPAEFAQWLLQATAETLAGKEHARVKSSNNNKDNLGIAELVDFGEAKYDPLNYKPGSDVEGAYGQKSHVLKAAQNIAAEFGFTINAEQIFNQVYEAKTKALVETDARRVNLDVADRQELRRLGLSDKTVEALLSLRARKAFGLLTVTEVIENLKSTLTAAEAQLLKTSATTKFLRLNAEVIVPQVLLAEVGGAEGLREVMVKTLLNMPGTDLAAFEKEAQARLTEKMTELGTNRFKPSWGSYGAQVELISSLLMKNAVSGDLDAARFTAKRFERAYNVSRCERIFAAH